MIVVFVVINGMAMTMRHHRHTAILYYIIQCGRRIRQKSISMMIIFEAKPSNTKHPNLKFENKNEWKIYIIK